MAHLPVFYWKIQWQEVKLCIHAWITSYNDKPGWQILPQPILS
ncbi:MAG TPA: hypothetical protein VHO70_10330 [Chitinispirillaceae bacterium]|nr:hypothetical protein [Chitinispirillaceae bacterium]